MCYFFTQHMNFHISMLLYLPPFFCEGILTVNSRWQCPPSNIYPTHNDKPLHHLLMHVISN